MQNNLRRKFEPQTFLLLYNSAPNYTTSVNNIKEDTWYGLFNYSYLQFIIAIKKLSVCNFIREITLRKHTMISALIIKLIIKKVL